MGQHAVHRALVRIPKLERLVLYYLAVSGLIELLAIKWPLWGRLGTLQWMLTLALLTGAAAGILWWLVRTSLRQRSYWILAILSVWLTLLGLAALTPAHIHHEATQEAACFINSGLSLPDWGYRAVCFLGYPLRGYITQGLPSMLLGRTPAALYLGGAWYILLGLIFAAGGFLRFWLKQNRPQAFLASAIALSLPLHAFYLHRFLFGSFEQGSFAVGLGFLILGSFAWLSAKPNALSVLLVVLSVELAIFAYTPALGVAVIGMSLLAWYGWRRRSKTALMGCLVTMIWLLSSISFRQDVRLNPVAQTVPLTISGEAIALINNLMFNQPQPSFFSFPGNVLFWFVLLWALIKGRPQRLAVGVTLGLLLLAITAQGYAYYPQDFRIHRALVIIPILSWLLGDWLSNFKPTRMLIILLFALTVSGLLFHYQYLQTRLLDDRTAFTLWLQSRVNQQQPLQLAAWEMSGYHDFGSLNDFLGFFLPHTSLLELTTEPVPNIAACQLPKVDYLLLPTSSLCHPILTQNNRAAPDQIYLDTQSVPFELLDLRYTRELP